MSKAQSVVPAARRRFIRLVGGGTVAAALPLAGCSAMGGMPDVAVAPWRGPAAETELRRWALSWAILAPNPHNRQPWLVSLEDEDALVLSLDTDRLLPETDPFSRQILVGTGAFLGLLELAARQRGTNLDIETFPAGAFGDTLDARPVARVRFIPGAPVSARESELFAQVPKRHTYREAYAADNAPAAAFTAFLEAENRSGKAGLSAGVVGRADHAPVYEQLSSIAREAWRIELSTPHTMRESLQLLRIGSDEIARHRDGISMTSPMMVMLDTFGMVSRTEPSAPDSMAMKMQLDAFNDNLATTPGFFWLLSEKNDRVTQLAAGRAYVRAQLAATLYGMVMHPVSQALQEYAEVAGPYRDVHETLRRHAGRPAATAQMLCRIGQPAAGMAAATPAPRRGLAAHLKA
ncbi:MAG: twin-arginine translocation pathway signal protein [Burkholderiaceae bacterium]